jgi:CheY-like chemotaxis protein
MPEKLVKIFLVEDNQLAGMLAQSILKTYGCDVSLVGTGEQAIQLFDESYDLVLMDLGLPGIDGFAAAEQIRQQPGGASVPIIALTANVDDAHRARCKAAGINAMLTKPADRDTLASILDKYALTHRYSESTTR